MKHIYEILGRINYKGSMSSAGDVPGKGIYMCMNCGKIVIIYDNTESLPVCTNCHSSLYQP